MLAVISMAGWMLVTTTLPRLAASARPPASSSPEPTPMVIMTALAIVPQEAAAIGSIASSIDAAVCVAPNSIAFSRFDSMGSIAQICFAPASFAP